MGRYVEGRGDVENSMGESEKQGERESEWVRVRMRMSERQTPHTVGDRECGEERLEFQNEWREKNIFRELLYGIDEREYLMLTC